MKPVYALCLAFGLLAACADPNQPTPTKPAQPAQMLDSIGWYWERECPEDLTTAATIVQTDSAIRLSFFGWNEQEDYRFALPMPQGTFRLVLLEYTMCGWNKGPAQWDMTTELFIQNPQDNQWYELQRAITPYGGNFPPSWNKKFYIDVTHWLPVLASGQQVAFKIYYGGWDATETNAHALQLKFYFFTGENPMGTPLSIHKVYDSFASGNNGYRAWAYGVQKAPIEDDARLGLRTFQLPKGTQQALFRVCITGHGQERSTSVQETGHAYQGYFVGRATKASNPAEFDPNWYTLRYNGQTIPERGYIWELNSGNRNYNQAGTYTYSRAGWGPGKPANVHYWLLTDIPADGKITLDLDLDDYISNCEEPNAAYVANYYVMADLFTFE